MAISLRFLDAIGDLYLLGAPLIGRFEGLLAGHGLNNALVRALLARPQAWRLRTLVEDLRVYESIFLGHEPRKGFLLDRGKMKAEARALRDLTDQQR